MIDYEFVDYYYSIKKHENREKELMNYIYDSLKESIETMFKHDKSKCYDFTMDDALSNLDIMAYKNGYIQVYFYDVRLLDKLKINCSCFENNIKMTLNRLGETIRFIFNTEVD